MKVLTITYCLGMVALFGHIEEVRPIKIQVLDHVSKQPIANVEVVYDLVTERNKHFLGIQHLDSFEYPTIIKEKTKTNIEGFVYFPKRKVHLRLYEEVFREYIYINLVPVEKVGDDPDNPIKDLKGVFIESSKYEIPPNTYRTLTFKKSTHMLNGKSLSKESDELVVELGRIKGHR